MIRASHRFPRGFLWGTATSSHQVEGDNRANDWWAWELEPDRILRGDRSDAACGWWQGEWQHDLERAAQDGQNTHRLSIEWSRVEPECGRWDQAALDFYREVLRGALDRGLIPMVTLHHFTNPAWVAEQGGWENPEIVGWFDRYTRQVAAALEGLVGLWITINEPNVYATLAYLRGLFPPGVSNLARAGLVLEHMLAAHAASYRALHEYDPACLVGIAHHYRGFEPWQPSNPLDAWAARLRQTVFNDLFPQAVTDGKLRFPGRRRSIPQAAGTQDFFGLNYYTCEWVRFDPRRWGELFGRSRIPESADLSPTGHMVNHPEGMWRALQWAHSFRLPIYLTENGIEDPRDHIRPRYLAQHLRQVWRAANANWGVRGYYHWTLVDNFEWERGWTQRFGLHALDRKSGTRTRRGSADLYAEICKSNSLTSEMVARYAPEAIDLMFPGGRSLQGLARAP